MRRFGLAAVMMCILGASPLTPAQSLGDLGAKLPQNGSRREAKNTKQVYSGPKKRIAVMDMEVKVNAGAANTPTSSSSTTQSTVQIPNPNDFGTGLAEMLTTALVNSGQFVVLERKALQDVNTEQAVS
jgi:curli biogenesis system outer membrane secretion channel CsgG